MLQLCLQDNTDGKIIRYMFLCRLPPSSIADLAARADALMDAEAA